MTTILPISKLTYAARLERLKQEQPLQSICNKCGTLSVPFYAGCCWLCCHADNPTFGTSDFRKGTKKSAAAKAENKIDLEAWVGRDVEFRTNTSTTSPCQRGVVVRVAKGFKTGKQLCVRSHETGKECYRRLDQVRLVAQTEDANVLQQTA